jgi:hypothetical protein
MYGVFHVDVGRCMSDKLEFSYVSWTSTEMVDSCLAEPSGSCCNRSGIHPMGIEIRHCNILHIFESTVLKWISKK